MLLLHLAGQLQLVNHSQLNSVDPIRVLGCGAEAKSTAESLGDNSTQGNEEGMCTCLI